MTPLKLWNKNFILFAVGWEFSLIGNALLRFALPLYILKQTGDPALMGTVLALSAIPYIGLVPLGGFIADRVNKRKLLVLMNVLMALSVGIYLLSVGLFDLLAATTVILMTLFALEGFVSPTAEVAVPLLVPTEKLSQANSATFMIATFSSVGAPILAGYLLEHYGLVLILILSIICFFAAALVKFFVPLPYKKPKDGEEVWTRKITTDFKKAILYLTKENRMMGKLLLILMLFSMILSPLVTVAFPVLITLFFGDEPTTLGFMQGIIVSGATVGVLIGGIFGQKLSLHLTRPLLFSTSLTTIPLGIIFMLTGAGRGSYIFLVISLSVLFAILSLLGIVMWTYIGEHAPSHLMGKIMSLSLALMSIGIAIGELLHSRLLDYFIEEPHYSLFISSFAIILVALFSKIRKEKSDKERI